MADEANTSLAARRILVVEDEILICLLIETILSDAGYEVVVANSIDEAMNAVAPGGGGRDIEGFPERPWVGKPFQEAELLDAVDKLLV
jgi:hypothetical protein